MKKGRRGADQRAVPSEGSVCWGQRFWQTPLPLLWPGGCPDCCTLQTQWAEELRWIPTSCPLLRKLHTTAKENNTGLNCKCWILSTIEESEGEMILMQETHWRSYSTSSTGDKRIPSDDLKGGLWQFLHSARGVNDSVQAVSLYQHVEQLLITWHVSHSDWGRGSVGDSPVPRCLSLTGPIIAG